MTRRAAVSLLGMGALGGAGWYLSRGQLTASDLAEETPTETAPTTETPTEEASSFESPAQQAKLAAGDGGRGDQFGWSVALSSDGFTALIGAVDDGDPNGDRAGSVYVFDRSGSSWNQQAKLVAIDGNNDDQFGDSVALSSDGSTALIGAPDDDISNDPGSDVYDGAGSAYVFDRSGASWTQEAKLTSNDSVSGDNFGESVALSGDGSTALIGAGEETNLNDILGGSAYVFDSAGGSWSRQAKLAANDGDSEDLFGWSVALSSDGTTALIGAVDDEDPNGDRAGSAYVFDKSGSSWSQQAKLAADDGDANDQFGYSVALSNDGFTALIGAYNDEDPNGKSAEFDFSGAGSAYVFDRSSRSWSQQAKLAADDGDSDDRFGDSVVLSSDGSTALIGASGDEDPNGEGAGSAYVFE